MTSTRLNKVMRTQLARMVDNTVFDKEARDAYLKAHKACEKMIRAEIRRQWPPKEMAVLAKYGLSATRVHVPIMVHGDIGVSSNERFTGFDLDSEQGPLVMPYMGYQSPRLKIEGENALVWRAMLDAKTAMVNACREKAQPLHLLIGHATTLEQIEEVWTEARKVRPAVSTLPTVSIGSLQDQVRAVLGN